MPAICIPTRSGNVFELSAKADTPDRGIGLAGNLYHRQNRGTHSRAVFGNCFAGKKKMMGSVAFFQDLREIKRLERELVNSERLAAIGQTVAGMAHCIKNILHGFKGGSYLVNVGIDKNNTG